jgi:ABC-type proline/glycine betaine transport system ATPase subunit
MMLDIRKLPATKLRQQIGYAIQQSLVISHMMSQKILL